MIVHFDEALRPNHAVHHASPEYMEFLRGQADPGFVHIDEAVPLHELAIERAGDGLLRAFHAPPEGKRREIRQAPLIETDPVPPAADLETARAALLRQADAYYGRQATLRFPLAAIHAAKARADVAAHVGEAAARDMDPEDLATAIRQKAADADAALLALDADRRALKAAIAVAADHDALAALQARLS